MAEDSDALSAYISGLRRLWTTHGSPSTEEIADRTRGEAFALPALRVEQYLQGKAFPGSGMELHFLLRGITNGYGRAWSYHPNEGETESEVARVIQLWREGTSAPEGPPTVPFNALPQRLAEAGEAFSNDSATVDTEPPRHQPAPPPLSLPSTVDTAVNNVASDIGQGTLVQAGTIGGDVTINVAPDPLAIHPVPVIVTLTFTDGAARQRCEQPTPDCLYAPAGTISVLVEGRSARAVILHGLHVVVQARRPVICQPNVNTDVCHRILRPRCFNLNLNAEQPVLSPVEGQPDFPFTVSATDPELFEIDPGVWEQEVDFRFALDWSCAGQNGTVLLPETGLFRKGPDVTYTRC